MSDFKERVAISAHHLEVLAMKAHATDENEVRGLDPDDAMEIVGYLNKLCRAAPEAGEATGASRCRRCGCSGNSFAAQGACPGAIGVGSFHDFVDVPRPDAREAEPDQYRSDIVDLDHALAKCGFVPSGDPLYPMTEPANPNYDGKVTREVAAAVAIRRLLGKVRHVQPEGEQ